MSIDCKLNFRRRINERKKFDGFFEQAYEEKKQTLANISILLWLEKSARSM